MELSEISVPYNPQEEIKKFWPSKSNNLGENQKEISLITLPNSKIFKDVSKQLRKWSSLGIIRPFLLIDSEDFQLKDSESDADMLRKNCEFIFPSFFKSVDDNTKLINPLFPYLADLGEELNLIRFVSVVSPDLDKGNNAFFQGITKLKRTLEENKNTSSIRLFTSRLIIPTSRWLDDEFKTLQGCISIDANINLLVSPEDRPSPGAVNQGVLTEDNYVSHACFFISTAANLWIGSKETPFDNYEPNLRGEEDFRLMRGYGRLVVASDVVEKVASGIKYDDGNFKSPNNRIVQTPRLTNYIEKKSQDFVKKYIINSEIKNSPSEIDLKESSFKQYSKYLLTRFRFKANSIFYSKDQIGESVIKDEVNLLDEIKNLNFDEDYILKLSDALLIEKGIDLVPNHPKIYEDFIKTVLSEVDGSNLFIEENRDSKFQLILNADFLTSNEDSLISKIQKKVFDYKNILGTAFAEWFKLFYREYKKDVDGSVKKLLSALKRLRFVEILCFILLFLNLLWLGLYLYQLNGGQIIILDSQLFIPLYYVEEGSLALFGTVLLFIASTVYGYILKNKVFGTRLSIFEIKNILEKILVQYQETNMIDQHLNDWSVIVKDFVDNPFINEEINSFNNKSLYDLDSIAKAFQIAEGEINPVVIEEITSKFTIQGWLVDLYHSNFEKLKNWLIEQNRPLGRGIEIEKAIYSDLSNLNQSGLRNSFKEYVIKGFATINGRNKLESEIASKLKSTSPSEIFARNITIIEERGEKVSSIEKFFGELNVDGDSDLDFLNGVWSNLQLVNRPEETKVERNIIFGEEGSDISGPTEQRVKFMDLDLAVKAGTPIQSLYLRIDISGALTPDAVGKWDRNVEPFEDIDGDGEF